MIKKVESWMRKFWNGPEYYSGIYKSFQECKVKNTISAGFNNPKYAKWSRDKTDRYLKRPIHMDCISVRDLKFLMYIQSLLDRLDNIRIFDFGGGVGWHYIKLFKHIKEFSRIHYTICDVSEVVYVGREYFYNKNFRNIEFTTNMPDEGTGFDMCILSSISHYIEDYKGLFKDIAMYNPRFIFLSRLPAGDLNEFVTLQTIRSAQMPCYVFNWRDIKKILSDLNYFAHDEWDERELFFLNDHGNKIRLPTHKGALFVCNGYLSKK